MTTEKTNSKAQAGGYQQVFKNVDDILHKDSGCTSELDYTEQSSWLLFLKYLDALEETRSQEAKLTGKKYVYILESQYRWSNWASPRKADGSTDHHKQQTGPDLLDFVNDKLFPYLRGFKERAATSNTIEYKIGEIFAEIRNRISSGYNLRDVINDLDKLTFKSQKQKHELSDLYEVKIKNMGNAGRNGGEYYTPRPLIRAIIDVVDPKIGETIYDGACGSAGFLCEAFEHLTNKSGLTTTNLKTLQEKTFYGREKKPLAYVIAVMNMILHGIDAPNVLHANTLTQNLDEIQEKDRYMVVLANPPFGGKERSEVQQNFPIKSSETAYLFLQHFIKILKTKGRAGVVIKNTFLSNTDNASVELRKHLLSSCDLHTVLDLPSGTFQGAGVRTVVLFFEKGTPTKKVWFYQLNPGRNFGKTSPLNDDDLQEFITLQKTKAESANSWSINVKDIDQISWDLSVRNPNAEGPRELGTPTEILAEIEALDTEDITLVRKLSKYIEPDALFSVLDAKSRKLEEVSEVFADGDWIESKDQDLAGIRLVQTGNIGEGVFKDRREKSRWISEETFTRLNCTEIYPGDILISRLPDPVGRACLIPATGDRMITAVDCTIVRPKQEVIDSEFLVLYASTSEYDAQVRAMITGTTRDRISRKNLGNVLIPVPSISEQREIVSRAAEITAACESLGHNAAKREELSKDLRKSVLDAAFRGEL